MVVSFRCGERRGHTAARHRQREGGGVLKRRLFGSSWAKTPRRAANKIAFHSSGGKAFADADLR